MSPRKSIRYHISASLPMLGHKGETLQELNPFRLSLCWPFKNFKASWSEWRTNGFGLK